MNQLITKIEVINLDAIAEDATIMATVDAAKLIMTKAQLFARLGRRRPKRNGAPTNGKASKVKSEK